MEKDFIHLDLNSSPTKHQNNGSSTQNMKTSEMDTLSMFASSNNQQKLLGSHHKFGGGVSSNSNHPDKEKDPSDYP